MRPAVPTQKLSELTMEQMARQVEEQQQEIERLQLYNNELLIENERLRKMYPAWMEEFAVRYDAVGEVDGRKLGAPSLELRKAMARMLPDSHILTPWSTLPLVATATFRQSMSGDVMLSLQLQSDVTASDAKWVANVRYMMSERETLVPIGSGLFNILDEAKRAMDAYAIRHGWYPLGVGEDVLRAAMEAR